MTVKLTMRDFLSPQAINAALPAATKKDALMALAALAGAQIDADPLSIFDILWEREKLGTTGVGNGIAIPHGRAPGLEKVGGFFAKLQQPIAFEAVDDKPVDLIFLLLAPESAGADHLQALAMVSRLLRDAKLCEQLRRAADAETLHRLLTETNVAEAA